MARQVRPWLVKPARVEAPRVRAIDWGPNQRIPSGTAAMPHQSPNVRLQSLPLRHRLTDPWQSRGVHVRPYLAFKDSESSLQRTGLRDNAFADHFERLSHLRG